MRVENRKKKKEGGPDGRPYLKPDQEMFADDVA
jgi:hypothetical protein